jgi:CMP-N,N'-diacetyllegionaminic acid synthase
VTPSLVAFVPARSGSERVPGKNIRVLGGHPLLAYSIATGQQSGAARVVCSTDSEEIAAIARWYGADVVIRPAELATSTSPDIQWLRHAFAELDERYDLFAILRPTSPFRGPETVRRALEQLLAHPDADSIRAVEPVTEHPGKMWVLEGDAMRPLLDQSGLAVPWHDSQFKSLQPVYIQNSSLEIAWSRVVDEGTLGGRVRLPFITEVDEGFSIDLEEEWEIVRGWVELRPERLPRIDVEPWRS